MEETIKVQENTRETLKSLWKRASLQYNIKARAVRKGQQTTDLYNPSK